MRLTRSSMLEVLGTDYIKFARLKGLHEQVVLWKHGLKNALLPVITFAVMLFVQFLGGAVVTETVFAWPGLGRLILESITTRDYPDRAGRRAGAERALPHGQSAGRHAVQLAQPENSLSQFCGLSAATYTVQCPAGVEMRPWPLPTLSTRVSRKALAGGAATRAPVPQSHPGGAGLYCCVCRLPGAP